jgi:hypothetical protein
LLKDLAPPSKYSAGFNTGSALGASALAGGVLVASAASAAPPANKEAQQQPTAIFESGDFMTCMAG